MSNMTRELIKTERTSEEYVNAVGSGYEVEDVAIIELNGKEYGVYVTDSQDSMHEGQSVFRFQIMMPVENESDRKYWKRVMEITDGNFEGYGIETVFDKVDEEFEQETESETVSQSSGNSSSLIDIIVDIFK